MIANRPTDALRQRQWAADAVFLHRETGALHPRTQDVLEQVRGEWKGRHRGWQFRDAKELLGAERRSNEKARHARRVV